ncbi:MAG: hypothetical protein RLZZ118_593 [Bacteroidota bacterium]|jgi:hypothetical protein
MLLQGLMMLPFYLIGIFIILILAIFILIKIVRVVIFFISPTNLNKDKIIYQTLWDLLISFAITILILILFLCKVFIFDPPIN